MANEITLTSSLGVTSGTLNVSQSSSKQIDQTNKAALVKKVSCTTSDTALSFTGLTAVKAIQIENTDATNYVTIGPDVAGAIAPFARLYPGQNMAVPLTPSITVRAQANTATVIIALMAVDT